ncbi:Crossover junction endodeoxyribonuclease RuvC [Candidatus Desulfarcum epimagneticum]|uniref:Crossover junction endodeoxyribonuclease RuvC n=1 Tax=uncultured Desulfobacteraceae bacterium TaxID=218296 RepID=A0A484HJ85_9BACT|nr:Crossover junction endodeoxyribonuclease RuvC [uncultured Desulfobacteraceae bacterium]
MNPDRNETARGHDAPGTVRIVGIDPGLAATGVGIVRGSGHRIQSCSHTSISSSPKDSLPDRLNVIFSRVRDILDAEKPHLMVIEDIFSNRAHPASGITLGKVTGVILLAGRRAGVPVLEVPAREAKKVITGNGAATKSQMELSVRRILSLKKPIRPHHAADAMGMSLMGFYRYGPAIARAAS